MSDSLLQRVASGSEVAFSELYDRFSVETYAICSRFVRHPEAAENIMFDLWMSIWQDARKLSRDDADTGAILTTTALAMVWATEGDTHEQAAAAGRPG